MTLIESYPNEILKQLIDNSHLQTVSGNPILKKDCLSGSIWWQIHDEFDKRNAIATPVSIP